MRSALVLFSLLLLFCSPVAAGDQITIVESYPLETSLDLHQIPQAADVWLAMIGQAEMEICVESFYFSDDPDDADDALDRVLAALRAAADRGVKVRLIGDMGFHKTYPQILDDVATWPGASVRLLDARAVWGGVQHAKFMIVDRRDVYIGSQNWDWRALSHIHEVGARVVSDDLAPAVQSIFDWDWSLAGGHAPAPETSAGETQLRIDQTNIRLAASPPQALPPGVPHDEPLLVDLIDRARKTLRLHLLSYNPGDRDGGYYDVLDGALRRAAVRGVDVKIILSNWAKRDYMLPHIKSLVVLENVEVRFTNIPEHSSGHIPFARVEHPKYLVIDEREAWLGTSNWSRSYFRTSRNLSLFLEGGRPVFDLIAFFDNSWNSDYAETVDPCAAYTPPRRED